MKNKNLLKFAGVLGKKEAKKLLKAIKEKNIKELKLLKDWDEKDFINSFFNIFCIGKWD